MVIDLGDGVFMKDVEGTRKRRDLIRNILFYLTASLGLIKLVFPHSMSWLFVFAPAIAVGSCVGFLFLASFLIMHFARDF